MSVPAMLHPVDYTSRDYLALRGDLINVIRSRIPEWQADDPSDFGVALVEAFSYMGDILNYYIDRAAAETFLGTASQRQSLLNIANLLGYSPSGRVAARVPIDFINTSGVATSVPAGARVATSIRTGDMNIPVQFEADYNKLSTDGSWGVPGGGAGLTIPCSEGATVHKVVGQSNGLPGQTYTIRDAPLINRSLEVAVGPDPDSAVPYAFVQNLYEATPVDNMFTYRTTDQGVTSIIFGDGVSGTIPDMYQNIYATYRLGGGVVGNITHGYLFTPVDFTFLGIITNKTRATGGSEEETNEQIRQSAYTAFRSRNSAVTKQDFEDMALTDNRVSKAKARGNSIGNMSVYVAPSSSGAPKTDPQPGYDAYNVVSKSMASNVATLTLASAPQFTTAQVELSGMGLPWDGTVTATAGDDNIITFPLVLADHTKVSCSGVMATGELQEFADLRAELATKIQERGVIGNTVRVYPPRYFDLKLEVEIGIHSHYRQSSAIAATKSALHESFNYLKVPFNMTVRPQEILADLVATVPELKYASVKLYLGHDSNTEVDSLIASADQIVRLLEHNLAVTVSSSDRGIANA